MLAAMSPFLLLTGLSLPPLLFFEVRGRPVGRWIFKPLASLGFLGLAWSRGAAEPGWTRGAFLAFALCALGDLLLIPSDKRAFLLGLLSFLLGHLGFALAFAQRGLQPRDALLALLPLLLMGSLVLRWLWPHLSARMRAPVLAYVLAIALMVACAFATVRVQPSPPLLLGAVLFFLSDLFVARQRFVRPGVENRLVGLPLYYAGTLLMASAL